MSRSSENSFMNYTKVYKETQIETASPVKLIVILYEIIINSIEQAKSYMAEKKYDLVNKELSRAQDGIIELIAALDFERGGDIAKNLYSIYLFCSRRLFEGNIEKNPQMLDEVKNILSNLKEAWEKISTMVSEETTTQSQSTKEPTKSIDIEG
jgi:flagellar protein FliS